MTTATKRKRPNTKGFQFEGEFLDVENGKGREWRQRYAEAAKRLREAKDAVVTLEDEIKLKMRGHEKLRDDGEIIVNWAWGASNHLDAQALKQEEPEVYARFFVQGRARSFKVNGVANVEVN